MIDRIRRHITAENVVIVLVIWFVLVNEEAQAVLFSLFNSSGINYPH